MRTPTILAAAMILGVLAWPATTAAQPSSMLFGRWRLNVAKSTTGAGAAPGFKRGTCTIEPWEDGVKVTYDMVRLRGGITHLEWRGAFDGKDYPVEGVESAVTNAYTRLDDRTYEIVQKLDGDVAARARLLISGDGKTITTVTSAANAPAGTPPTTTVYDRE